MQKIKFYYSLEERSETQSGCCKQSNNMNKSNRELNVEPIVALTGGRFGSTIPGMFFHCENCLEACRNTLFSIVWQKHLRRTLDVGKMIQICTKATGKVEPTIAHSKGFTAYYLQ